MNPFGQSAPCAGTQATLPTQCQCSDPGLVQTGQNVVVTDANLCPRRLTPNYDGSGNVVSGFLVYQGNGNVATVEVTNQPAVSYPVLSLTSGESFGKIVVVSGSTGLHYQVNPPGAANLFLQTDGAGGLEFAAPPTATVPDPLSIGTLNLSTALNASCPVSITGTITATGIAAGSVVNFVGLNSSNQLVTGTFSGISMSMFSDQTGPTDTTYPNAVLLANGNCIFRAQTYSDDNIAAFGLDTTSIKILETGKYRVDWQGMFGPQTTAGGRFSPSLQLQKNSAPVANGMQGGIVASTNEGGVIVYESSAVTGVWVGSLNVNDILQLTAIVPSYIGGPAPSVPVYGLNLRTVGVTLTKFH